MVNLKRGSRLPVRTKREEVPPYSVLARYYDDVMDHVDYKGWAAYVAKLLAKHGNERKSGIDFGCGTGKLAYQLHQRGFNMIGADGCADMIRVARHMRPKNGKQLEFYVADLREKPPVEPQPFALCLYDSLNYLLELAEIQKFFNVAGNVVEKGGLLIFDLSTIHNSLENFDSFTYEERVRGGMYRRVSRYDHENNLQHNVFDIYPDDDDFVYIEHHRQRIYPVDSILSIARDAGFVVKGIYDDMTMNPGTDESDRVHVVSERV